MIRKSIVLLIISVLFSWSQTPQRPFPQQVNFPGCIKPSNVTQANMDASIMALYDAYKTKYLAQISGHYYIKATGNGDQAPGDVTISEAHGYGMIIMALMAGYDASAKTYFDGMYQFFKANPSESGANLMEWSAGDNSVTTSSATDGDMDIAYALILADKQWGSTGTINYLQEAKNVITQGIKAREMNTSNYRIMVGDWWQWSDPQGTRSSDWMTGHLHAFQTATNDPFWGVVADTVYKLITQITTNYSATTGLIPDFITGSPARPDVNGAGTGETYADRYYYNACRVPWRLALDYAHNGTPAAQTATAKILSWLRSKTGSDPANIVDGYNLNGTNLGTYPDLAFVAPFAAGAITDPANQTFLNNLWGSIKSNQGSNEYLHALNLLSMLLISGNWWGPYSTTTPVESQVTVVNGSGDGLYTTGDQVTIVANEAPVGWEFASWSGDLTSVSGTFDSVATFTMGSAPLTFTANYRDPNQTYAVTVTNGGGSGAYKAGQTVVITANQAPANFTFNSWIGDISKVSGTFDSVASFVMVAEPLTFTARYSAPAGWIDTTALSANLLTYNDWTSSADAKSSAVVDSSQISVPEIGVSLSLATKGGKYAQAALAVEGTYELVNTIKITYSANTTVSLVLKDDALIASGAAFSYTLPAATDTTIYLPLDSFAQPSWVTPSSPDMASVTGVLFSSITKGTVVNLQLTNLQLNNFVPGLVTPIESVAPVKKASGMKIGVQSGVVHLQQVAGSKVGLELFTLSGRSVYKKEVAVTNGVARMSIPKTLAAQQLFVLRVTSLQGMQAQTIRLK